MNLNITLKQWTVVLLAVLAIIFTACSDDDDDLSSQVLLEAYGPSPALRGSDLTFIGRNMDQVTSVTLPDDIKITDIEIVSSEKIKVTIPQNAKEGYIKLETPGGEITSKTLLSYTEPIFISKISPNPVKAGDTLVVEGDYLNLIQQVIFADDVIVKYTDFTTWERAKIKLVMPKTAQTGTITLSDTTATPIELESDVILEVTLPSVTSVMLLEDKKPGDEISATVADSDLVEYIVLANKDSVDFTVSNNVILFSLPSGTADGQINMLAYSGVAVPIAQLTMAVPTGLVASSATDLRAGDVITVSGMNMDLVTTVIFPGVTNSVSPTSIEADKITVVIPDAAISGDLILNTASGNTVMITIITEKPEVTAYNPSPVSAGDDVTLEGTNLDLVASVTFSGGVTVDVTPESATSLIITVPVDAETGSLTLTMANGETVESSSLTVDKPQFCYVPVLPGDDVEINAGTILLLDIENGDKLTDVQVDNVTTQYILQGSVLYVLIPDNAGGETSLKLISSNGEVEYAISVIGSGITETVAWEGLTEITWADGGRIFVPAAAFEGVGAGSILKFYFQQKEAWGQAQINNGGWATIPFAELGNDGYITTDTYGDKSVSEQELVLTQEILDNIISNVDDSGNAIIIQGSDFIFSKVSIITQGGAASESIWTGSQVMPDDWSGNIQLSADLFTSAKVGDVIHVKTEDVLSGAQGSFKNGSWAAIADGTDYFDISGDFELIITADILTQLQSGGLIISGHDYTAIEVSIGS